VPARDIAVLFRINAQSEAYEQAFTDAGIPYVLRGAERFFERPAVREAVVRLRGAARAGADAETDGTGLIATVRHVLSGSGFTDKAPGGTGAAREKWESLAALAQLAEDMAADDPKAGLAEFVAELEERAQVQHAPPLEGVTLASLHAAKGLEWDAVFLIGLVDGTLPIIYAETTAQIEEERRLLYVGITRAKEHLSLSWALARAPGGRKIRRPSRFLDGLAPRTSTPTPARVERAKRGGGRSCQSCPADLDEALFTRLKEWRVEVSKALKVPAYVVFTDATLQAIAERKPVVEQDLSGIPGVGSVKLDRYGAAILALGRGETPPTLVDLGD
jgi:DNA helicase-2/ATP-dependent DNA helicase PcrA